MARLDVTKPEGPAFTGYFPYPADDQGLKSYVDPDATFFVPLTLKGKVISP